MDYQQLDPRSIRMWRVSRVITLAVLIVIFVTTMILLDGYSGRFTRPLTGLLVSGAVLVLQLINVVVYPLIEYRQWAYLITPDRIEIKKGIFFHSTRIIPISRIQHVTVAEGPLARHYKLARIIIHTAGGSQAIEGLDRATALTICDRLKDVVNRKIAQQPKMPEH